MSRKSNMQKLNSMRAVSPEDKDYYLDPVLTQIAENLDPKFRNNLFKAKYDIMIIKEDSLNEFAGSRNRCVTGPVGFMTKNVKVSIPNSFIL